MQIVFCKSFCNANTVRAGVSQYGQKSYNKQSFFVKLSIAAERRQIAQSIHRQYITPQKTIDNESKQRKRKSAARSAQAADSKQRKLTAGVSICLYAHGELYGGGGPVLSGGVDRWSHKGYSRIYFDLSRIDLSIFLTHFQIRSACSMKSFSSLVQLV